MAERDAFADVPPPPSAGFDLPGGESAIRAAVERHEAELIRVRADLGAAWDDCRRVRADLLRATRDRDDARAEVQRLDCELTGVRESLTERQGTVEDLEATLAMRTGQLKAASRERGELRTERDEAQAEIHRLFDLASSALENRSLAEAELASARQELDAVRTARDNLARKLAETRKWPSIDVGDTVAYPLMTFGSITEAKRAIGTVIGVAADGIVTAEFQQDGPMPMTIMAPAESFILVRTIPGGGS